jgi:hypothetical protein
MIIKMKFFLSAMMLMFLVQSCELISEIGDDDDDDNQALLASLPATVQTYLQTNYADYEIEEVQIDTLCDSTAIAGIEIELEKESTFSEEEVELFFDNNDNLIYTATEIETSALPVEVTNLIAQNYPTYQIDDDASLITFATGGGIWYEVEIEDNSTDIELEVTISDEWIVICEEVEDEDE